jgi:hypothetical protein
MLTTFRLPVHRPGTAAVVALLVAACSGATASPPPSGSSGPSNPPPSTAPTASPVATVGAIDHLTGATDVVLRLEQGGGFAPMELNASQAPIFTLYGNGIVIFKPKVETIPQPDAAGVVHGVPWRTARLDEGQIQDLLAFAIGPGGLGTAREAYIEGGVADVPNTIFTVKAGGLDKTVVVNALVEGGGQGPDAAARAAFARVFQRLSDFDSGGTIATDVYQPDAFRGVLIARDPQPGTTPQAWPWPALKVADFKENPNGEGAIAFPHRALSEADVNRLGVKDVAGGLQNILLAGTDGKVYGLITRPLLPDEPE